MKAITAKEKMASWRKCIIQNEDYGESVAFCAEEFTSGLVHQRLLSQRVLSLPAQQS